ncbi:hypothetical protein [Thermosulfurimonas dismutans]|uniref:Uncharacterized protein n=1 Tax=Thermosulfurimonas dismutans TaxID=999894 RepID=A0A179D2B5_9BACT|nr:hypothetical protein [Thermosulfurimonas dismutans]OAQ19788.1 hypothetical protein TDIS_2122 [Thermosulfurimonas dismutans]
METIILRVKPGAKPYLEWLLKHFRDEVEIISWKDFEELEEKGLIKAIEEGDRGEFVDEEEVMQALRE